MKPGERGARASMGGRWLPLAGLGLAFGAHAEVIIEPTVAVGVALTDNLTLDAANREHQTIYQVLPTLVLTQDSARLTTNLRYAIEGYYYDQRSDTDVYQNVTAAMTAALDPDNFFLELGGLRDQTIRTPELPIPRSNLPISANRVDRDDFYLGPRFRYPLGANVTASGSFRRNWVRYDAAESDSLFVRDFETDAYRFSFDNYARGAGLTWATSYVLDRTDYDLVEPWEYQQASLQIGTWIGQALRLFATGGKESAWDEPFDSSLEDGFWEVGLAHNPSANLALEVATGERTFGSSRRAEIDYTTARGQIELRYLEQPTTQGRDPYQNFDLPDLVPGEIEDFLNRAGSAERYISKRLHLQLALNLRRTSFALTVYDETREQRTQIDGTPLGDETQTGGVLGVTFRAGVRTTIGVAAEQVRQEFDGGQQDLRSLSLTADYRLGPRTGLAFRATRTEDDLDGNVPGVGAGYEADLVSLLLTRTF